LETPASTREGAGAKLLLLAKLAAEGHDVDEEDAARIVAEAEAIFGGEA
jgi:hypothetical protein